MRSTTLILALAVAAMTISLPDATAQAATHNVNAADNIFQPASINIAVGDTVQWDFVGANPHTVTSTTPGIFDSGVQTGGTFSHTFNSPGTFTYLCGVHGTTMSGTVTVAQPAPTNTPAATATSAPAPTNTAIPTAAAATSTPAPAATTPADEAPTAPAAPPPTSTAPSSDGTTATPGAGAGGAEQLPDSGEGGGASDLRLIVLAIVAAGAGAALAGVAMRRRWAHRDL